MRHQGIPTGRLLAGLAFFTLASASTLDAHVYRDYTPNPDSNWVAFAPSGASKGFQCYYPYLSNKEWEGCTHESRGCWIRQKYRNFHGGSYGNSSGGSYGSSSGYGNGGRMGWDVHTDYDDYAPVGVRRYYTYNVATKTIAPDGVPKEAILFDGIYPGPLLEACWGDEVVVTVVNQLANQGTTIHWHGVRQLFTNDMDGVPITQCPIARGDSFTYRFRVTQYGTSWYHSHYSLQYADGLAAPMIFHGPSSANYDYTVPEPLVVSDWVDVPAEVAYQDEKDPVKRGASTDSILLNGVGEVIASGKTRSFTRGNIGSAYPVIRIVPGKKNRIRIINMSIATGFVFSIDGHNLTIIGNDFVAVKPYTTSSIVVAIGQRYEIIIDALSRPSSSGNYWIRTQPADGCNRFTAGFFNTQANPPTIPFDVRTGILHYESPHTSFSVLPNTQSTVTDFDCADLRIQSALVPVVPWQISKPINSLPKSTFYAAHQTANDTGIGQLGDYAHWLLRLDPVVERKTKFSTGNKPFWIEFAKPTLLNLDVKDSYYNILHYSSKDRDGFIYMVIDGALLPTTKPADVNGTFIIPSISHPMHWHGSDVTILGQDTKPFDPDTSPKTWRFNNPPRRDTVTLPAGGYVAVAFKPDNPGAWLVHCHIAWHASAGLALQMIIQDDPKHIYRVLGQGAVNDLREGCKAWNRDVFRKDLQPILHKDDSGI